MSADSDMVERVAAAMAAVDRGEGYKVLARAALDASGIGELEQRIDALETALEPLALLAGDVNMNDPLRKWFSVAQLHDAAELLSRARATAGKGGAPDCPFCSARSTFSGDPARSFCDEHYRQYLLTFQIVPKDLAAYRARATQETPDAQPPSGDS